MRSDEWQSVRGEVLVRTPSGEPKLWVDREGELHDAIGKVHVYEQGWLAEDLEPEELAVFVAEWLVCVVERDGPIAYRDIHPRLRGCIYELAPSTVVVSDDDGVDPLVS